MKTIIAGLIVIWALISILLFSLALYAHSWEASPMLLLHALYNSVLTYIFIQQRKCF
jgi:hypothetical protein